MLIPLFGIYFATATTSLPYHIDALTNVLTGWHVAARGSIYLDESPDLANPASFRNVGWFVRTPRGHVVSQYPPGAALIAIPFYTADRQSTRMILYGNNDPDAPGVTLDLPSLIPAAAAASFATALAMALLALVSLQFLSPARAMVASYVAGLGTGAWAVASDSLWQHGPGMLWIALALYLTVRKHQVGAGLAFGMAILTRPHLALIAAAVGIAIGLARRSFRPVLEVGIGSSIGLAALLVYNRVVFGAFSVTGGYGTGFTEQAVHSSATWYLRNIAGAFVDPTRGLLIWTPFLIVLIPGLVRAWKAAPAWVKGAAIGGLLYLLLQLKANRFSGGTGFFAYRYPLEFLTAAAPLLVLAYREWISDHKLRTRVFQLAVLFSVFAQATGAISAPPP